MNIDRHTQIRSTSSAFGQPVDWRNQFAEACRSLRLSQQPLVSQHALLAGFRAQYKALNALPRRERRLIQRQWKHSLAGVALLFALGAQPALAATINVGGACTLIRAINSANNDTAAGGCAKGNGADTIVLPANSTHTLTVINNNTDEFGPTGLPVIRSVINIAGNGSTVRRAGSAPAFRLFAVDRRDTGSTCPSCGNLTLRDVTLTGGKAVASSTSPYSADGGALTNLGGVVTLRNVTVTGNTAAESGGGLNNDGATDVFESGSMTLVDSSVSGNSASGKGGGISNFYYSNVQITNSTVSGNTAGADGGGVFNGYQSDVTVTNSTISGNVARNGGGIHSYDPRVGSSADVRIANTTITGNRAEVDGGGLWSYTLDMNGSIVSGNSAAGPREIYIPEYATVTSSTFSLVGHSGLTNAQAFANFTPGGTDITATSDGDTPTALSAILNRGLASNGGATRTHALVNGSPAIDAINNGTCPPPATDQRGISRPRDGDGDGGVACDIGSFEVAKAPTPVPSAKCQGVVATVVGTAGDDYLVGTVGRDVIQGLAGNDRLVGLEGNDLICGGKGNDNVYGGLGNDRIYGELGDDRLLGVDGDDRIFGGSERDTMDGGVGTDRCDGGPPASGDSAANCEVVRGVP